MPSQQNVELLKDTTDKIAKSKALVVVEYQGLSVNDQVKLRSNIKAVGGELNVTKNRLVALALKSKFKDGLPSDLEEALQGPTAIMFGYDDAVAATKAIMDFAKDHESLKTKAGVLMADSADATDKVLTAQEVIALSKLPGRQELLTMLVIQLQSPIQGFYNVLKGNLSGLARVLNGIKEQKETN